MRIRPVVLAATASLLAAAALVQPALATDPTSTVPVFTAALKLPNAVGGTESRVAVAPDGTEYVISNTGGGTALVYASTDHGATWAKVPGTLPDQQKPTIDTDIVATSSGRLVATELDFAGVNFRTAYSDDGGKTWTASQGTKLADTDRPFLATGPNNHVYLLFHNLFSGELNHNMYVMTSTDGGATFGPPVPTAPPGSQAYLDLQCADSGGPSNIFVNQTTGRIYAVFGTRGSGAGGCQSAANAPELNVVAATRIWVATSPDGSLGSWTDSLAVDDSATGRIVGMQLAPGALDTDGNVYVFYPESPNAYPNYDGAAMRYVMAPGDLSKWSAPVTVEPGGGAGNVLPHIAVGAPGQIDLAYFHGVERAGTTPAWYITFTQTLDGLDPAPTFTTTQLSDTPTYTGTASTLMGACGSGPTGPIQNGLTCNRSTDVWGITLRPDDCDVVITWPSVTNDGGGKAATWVATQTDGPTACQAAAPSPSPSPSPSAS